MVNGGKFTRKKNYSETRVLLTFHYLVNFFSQENFLQQAKKFFREKVRFASFFLPEIFVTLTKPKNWSEKKFKGGVVCETILMADSYWTLVWDSSFPPNLLICQKFRKPGKKFGTSPVRFPSDFFPASTKKETRFRMVGCLLYFLPLIQNCVFACCKKLTCLTKKFKCHCDCGYEKQNKTWYSLIDKIWTKTYSYG